MQDRLNIAVFVDYDNIEIGLKSTLRREFDVALPLSALRARGPRRKIRVRELGKTGRRYPADGRERRTDGAAHSIAAGR